MKKLIFPLILSFPLQGFAQDEAHTAIKPANLEELVKKNASDISKPIENTTSPNKKFVASFGVIDGRVPKWELSHADEHEIFSISDLDVNEDSITTFLVNQETNRITTILKSNHSGSKNVYNHESYYVAWSLDSHWFVELQTYKWCSSSCRLYELDKNGNSLQCMDFLPTTNEIVRDDLKKQNPKIKQSEIEKYSSKVSDISLTNNGVLSATITAEIPKADDLYVFLNVKATLAKTKKGKTYWKILSVKDAPIPKE